MGSRLCGTCKSMEEDMEQVLVRHMSNMLIDLKRDLKDHISFEMSSVKSDSASNSSRDSDNSPPGPPTLTRQ